MRLFDSSRYERLPTEREDPPAKRAHRKLRIFGALVLGAIVVWTLKKIFYPGRPYNPLDDYQNLNIAPIIVENWEDSPPSRRAVVSALFSDGFALAVAVAGHSTHSANVSARLLLPYLENQVSEKALCLTRAVGWEPYAVPLIRPPHGGRGIHPRFKDLYTKLNIWALDKKGIDRAVFLDADTLVRRNFEELFESPFSFAAAPDVYGAGDARGFSLTFNSGVMAFTPSSRVLAGMLGVLEEAAYPPKQADQGFLNHYFGGTAMRLPYVYNANLSIKARSPVLWERLKNEMRVVHYTGVKPFLHDTVPEDVVLSLAQVEEAMTQAEARGGGLFVEEVRWWREAYERMMQREYRGSTGHEQIHAGDDVEDKNKIKTYSVHP
ncbi:glycosyltransferase family 8 protein [Mycena rebaudengoi]|nr:glycosyltransferase family 8 protein [Mycena rebaudengoi]